MNEPKSPTVPTAAPPRLNPIFDATQMEGKSPTDQASRAMLYILQRIRLEPDLGYELGLGSETYALLTEALATISAKPVREVREHFRPRNPARRGQADKERLDWLQERINTLPIEYRGLLGLASSTADLRDAIDRSRREEGGQR